MTEHTLAFGDTAIATAGLAARDGDLGATVRCDDEKGIEAGDFIEMVTPGDEDEGEQFGRAVVVNVVETHVSDALNQIKHAGAHYYPESTGQLVALLNHYYDADIAHFSEVKVITYEVLSYSTDGVSASLETYGSTGRGGPDIYWWCPWCEGIIMLGDEPATSEADAYWHAYDHRDKGPYAVTVMEAFEPLDTVVTHQHEVEPPDEDSDDEEDIDAE